MEGQEKTVKGNIIDVVAERIFKGSITIRDDRITEIKEENNEENCFILPGLIDAHIHVESSMLIPSEFARLAVVHGTVGTVSDPHEIANVLGIDGIRFMIENGKQVPFKFYFGASPCVPATSFETAGATIGIEELDSLLQSDEIRYMSEMMNFPGVLNDDAEVKRKLDLAKKYNKPIDGHAPGLTGVLAEKYAKAGITTDHECFTREEAEEKIRYGMKILIREGSAARNFEDLSSLIPEFPDKIMFCSDDKHPNDLVSGHINEMVKRAFRKGYDKIKVIRCCTYNPVKHYGLNAGLLQKGDPADLILVDNLVDFNVLMTVINGEKVAENGKSLIAPVAGKTPNQFNASAICGKDLVVKKEGKLMRVIEACDGQLVTKERLVKPKTENQVVMTDQENDILKIVVKNRYTDEPPVVGFVTGFGLKSGALASSVAHDSHNLIAVGASDDAIVEAMNAIIGSRGGIAAVIGDVTTILPLPVAGIMTGKDGYEVAKQYDILDREVKKLKSNLKAPFMTLSFMALLVIPELKLSDKGLFNGKNFSFVDLFIK